MWWGVCRGAYSWHAEEFVDGPWSRYGGKLDGDAAPRLAFLRQVLAAAPAELARNPVERHTFTLEAPGEYYLQYHGLHRYSTHRFSLPEDVRFGVEVVDTWEMTVDRLAGTFSGDIVLDLPRKPYVAVRITRC
nr:DUF5605 domain-containing protein [Auraticoccus cholistanensis]